MIKQFKRKNWECCVYHDGEAFMNQYFKGDAVSYNTESGDSNIQREIVIYLLQGRSRAPHIWGNLKGNSN